MAENYQKTNTILKNKITNSKIFQIINKKILRIKIKYLKYLIQKTIKDDYKWDDVFIKVTDGNIYITLLSIQEYAKDDYNYFTHKLKKIPINKLNTEIKSLLKILKNKSNGKNKFKNITKKISKGIKNVSRLFKLFIARS